EAAERPTGELEQVAPAEEVIEVDAAFYGRVLEERVGIVPGAKLRGGASETRGELRVEGALPACKRFRRCSVRLLECRGQLRLVHLVRLEREREPVAVPEHAGRLVAQAGELPHVVGDRRSDRLRRLPRLAPLIRIVALAQDPLDLVVVDLLAPNDTAVPHEPGADGGLELNDPRSERARHLLAQHEVMEEVEATLIE